MVEKINSEREIKLLCDVHGHAKVNGAFMYGCKYEDIKNTNNNNNNQKNTEIKILPYIFS